MNFENKLLEIKSKLENRNAKLIMRLVGVNIPDDKQIKTSLTYVYGVGNVSAEKILKEVKIDLTKRTKDLTQDEVAKIKDAIEAGVRVEGELRQSIRQDINRLKIIKSYRGTRHAKGLPVRGQSTKRNMRTRKGKRMTAGSGRRKLTLK